MNNRIGTIVKMYGKHYTWGQSNFLLYFKNNSLPLGPILAFISFCLRAPMPQLIWISVNWGWFTLHCESVATCNRWLYFCREIGTFLTLWHCSLAVHCDSCSNLQLVWMSQIIIANPSNGETFDKNLCIRKNPIQIWHDICSFLELRRFLD